jgi:two-component system, response regulator PdtaR
MQKGSPNLNSKGKILIVEDEPLCSNLLETFLEQLGYETTSHAASGAEALEIAKNEKPRIALMDFNLHGDLTGFETARSLFTQFGIGAIFVSGFPKEDLGEAIAGEWYLGYVSKPYDLDQLEQTVAAAMAKTGPLAC